MGKTESYKSYLKSLQIYENQNKASTNQIKILIYTYISKKYRETLLHPVRAKVT